MPLKDPAARKAYQDEYRAKNRKRRRAACKKWYYEHRDEQIPKYRAYYLKNREKLCAYAREYVAKNKELVTASRKKYYKRVQPLLRNRRFLNNYGITAEQRDAMAASQQWRCAICGSHVDEIPKNELYVDHCHTTGKVRELLCTHCNTGIGHFRDNVFTLHAAIAYLEKHHPEKRMAL
jgi:hypothetical protein